MTIIKALYNAQAMAIHELKNDDDSRHETLETLFVIAKAINFFEELKRNGHRGDYIASSFPYALSGEQPTIYMGTPFGMLGVALPEEATKLLCSWEQSKASKELADKFDAGLHGE